MIPKVIYQTWKTQNIHKKINNLHKRMLKVNPEYQHIIYTDDQMLDFVKSNYDKDIFKYLRSDNEILEKYPLQKHSKQRQLKAYKHKKFWHCIDTIRDIENVSNLLKNVKN